MIAAPTSVKEHGMLFKPPQEYFDNGFGAVYKHNKVPTEQLPQLLELAVQDAPIKAGDLIWVKEKAKVLQYLEADRRVQLQYESDEVVTWIDYPERLTWTPAPGSYFPRGSLFREAARLVLEITQVRVQRLQEISEEDAIAEGIESKYSQILRCTAYRDYSFKPTKFVKEDWLKCPIQSFRTLWNSINQDTGTRWIDNPWVWVYEFKSII